MSAVSVRTRRRKANSWVRPELERWQYPDANSSIVVTAEQVAKGLQNLAHRYPDLQTPLNVATVLLLRLERMRRIAKDHSAAGKQALLDGDAENAWAHADVIAESTSSYSETQHGICVTRDLDEYGIEQAR